MKRYAVCIIDDDGGTGEAVFTVKNKTEARARGRLYIRQWQLPNGKQEKSWGWLPTLPCGFLP